MSVYYNEIDAAAVVILRQLIADGVIAPGDVDTRSIKEVQADDLRGYDQCHFFAGGGLWSLACRMAGWADTRPIWTASCPCQPFSAAGKGEGTDDPRHLWPDLHRLVGATRQSGFGPSVLMGEQVAGEAGYDWFHGVRADLANEDIQARTVDFPACAVDAPHQRNRLYWCAVGLADDEIRERRAGLRQGRPEQDWFVSADGDGGQRHVGQADAERFVGGRDIAQRGPEGRAADRGLDEGSRRSVDLVDAESIGRGEGRAEHELRSGRTTTPGADAPSVDLVDGVGFRRQIPASGREPAVEGAVVADYPHSVAQGHASVEGRERIEVTNGLAGFEAGRADVERADSGDGGHGAVAQGDGHAQRRLQSQGPIGEFGGWPGYPDAGRNGTHWSDAEWIICHDGKARRAKSGLRLLVDGLPGRVDLWRVGGNAIVPEAAVEAIRALMDVLDGWRAAA